MKGKQPPMTMRGKVTVTYPAGGSITMGFSQLDKWNDVAPSLAMLLRLMSPLLPASEKAMLTLADELAPVQRQKKGRRR